MAVSGHWLQTFGKTQRWMRTPSQKDLNVQELNMTQAELEKIHVEVVKLMSETRKLNAEAGKMTRETFWYPVAIGAGMLGAGGTIGALLVKLMS